MMQGSIEVQDGNLYHWCWVESVSGNTAAIGCGIGPYVFQTDPARGPGDRTEILFQKAHPPSRVLIRAWALLDPNGNPVEPSEPIEVDELRQDPMGWRAAFSLPLPCKHYYLSVTGVWPDEQGTDTEQFAQWTFHAHPAPSIDLPPEVPQLVCPPLG